MKFKYFIILLFFISVGCSKTESPKKITLLIYCGITMVKPMNELIYNFEKANPNVNIILSQGGSQDLYNSLKTSKKGDLYLPGATSYRSDNLKEGFLGKCALLGYNQAALVVKKGNPKGFGANINELATTKYAVGICNPQSGSIGRMTKIILLKANIFREVVKRAAVFTTDSRNLTKAVKDNDADIVVNWKATAFWPSNKDEVEALVLSDEVAPKKKLLLNILTFSKEPVIAENFFNYAASEKGLQIFKKWGF